MRVFDCFLFNGEADMLELRLHELADVVDVFVIIEGLETFTGTKKNMPEMSPNRLTGIDPFLERCCRIGASRIENDATAWEREAHQRNHIGWALDMLNAQPDDLILVSDVDEIPRASVVRMIAENPTLRQSQCALQQTVYFYHPQCLNLLTWYGTRSVNYRNFRTAQELRATEHVRAGEIVIGNGGWHFSYFMDTAAIQRKLAAYSHTEVNQAPYNTPENIEAAMRECRSLVPTDGQTFRRVTPTDLPAYMVANAERYGLEVTA